MADQRITNAAVLTDPTTSTQQATVDANGDLGVILAANSGVDIGDVDILSIAAGDNNIGNVDVVTMPDVTSGAAFTVQEDGAALTALQLLDDAVYTDDDDWTDTTSKHLLVGGLYQSTPQSITDGDVGPLEVDANGYLKVSLEANPVGVGGSTQYTEDDVVPANPVGNSFVVQRIDTPAAITPAAGDWTHLFASANGELHVNDTDAVALLTTIDADTGTIAGDTTSIDSKITACNTGAVTISAALPAGSATIGEVTIGTATTAATDLAKAIDTAAATADVGVAALAVRDDTLSIISGTEGDWEPMHLTATGALWTEIDGGTVDTVTAVTTVATVTNLAQMGSAAISMDTGVRGPGVQRVTIATDDSVPTVPAAPTNPVIDVADADTPTTIAPATPTNVDSPDLTTKKLTQAIVASTVPFKVVISTLSAGSATTVAVRTGGPGADVVWDTPNANYAVSGTTVAGFRARITNLDPADTADFYVTWAYED